MKKLLTVILVLCLAAAVSIAGAEGAALEENALAGGFGAAVTEYLADAGIKAPVLRIGIPDRFVPQGARKKLLESCGLLPEQIADKIMEKWTGLS